MEKNTKMNIFDLEYSKLEKAEMITYLNKLLSSYQVYAHKTRIFHWNVVGQDHFDLNQKFRNLHLKASAHMDEIAGRIRLFSQKTIESWKEILETSEVDESASDLTGFEMVKTLAGDLKTLLTIQSVCVEKARELGDYGTEGMVGTLIGELEQDYLLLVSWLK